MRPLIAPVVALIALSTVAAAAADLPAPTRLGAIFAEPAPDHAHWSREYSDRWIAETVFAPEVDIPPLVGGYYGKPNSYLYRPYYGGTSPEPIFNRLPYACGIYGYC